MNSTINASSLMLKLSKNESKKKNLMETKLSVQVFLCVVKTPSPFKTRFIVCCLGIVL